MTAGCSLRTGKLRPSYKLKDIRRYYFLNDVVYNGLDVALVIDSKRYQISQSAGSIEIPPCEFYFVSKSHLHIRVSIAPSN